MLKRTTSVVLGLALILIIGGLVYDSAIEKQKRNSQPQNTGTTTPSTSGITLVQVSEHNSRTNCWAAINGNVYNLTGWIPNHPGGEQRILNLCGKDGSNAFNGQHAGQPQPLSILSGFKIGTLAK